MVLNNVIAGLYVGEEFNLAPLAWSVVEALRTCFPVVFCLYLVVYRGFPQEWDGSSLSLAPNVNTGFGEVVMDSHKGIYSSFIDDSRASSNLNDVDKIRLRGYNKYRYVSSAFLKRNRLVKSEL